MIACCVVSGDEEASVFVNLCLFYFVILLWIKTGLEPVTKVLNKMQRLKCMPEFNYSSYYYGINVKNKH